MEQFGLMELWEIVLYLTQPHLSTELYQVEIQQLEMQQQAMEQTQTEQEMVQMEPILLLEKEFKTPTLINRTFSNYWKYLFDILYSDQFCKIKIFLFNQKSIQ